jgi:molybdopterin/thiamine biosynthesis adenylyltransferase
MTVEDGMERLSDFLREHAEGDLVPWRCQVELADRFSISLAEAERAILEAGLLPARYQRNRNMLTTGQQLRLCQSRVAVVGCGGLGGYIIEELARLGVGRITAIDPDVFEEHNLNRQLLSSPLQLGSAKVEAAVRRVGEINPAVTVIPLRQTLSRENGRELLSGADVVMDGLDAVAPRLALAESCRDLAVPLVHGAIAGWYGQIATLLPGDDVSPRIFRMQAENMGIEKRLGNPSFTPAVIASLQVAEACKILLDEGECLKKRMLFINLLDMEIVGIDL